MLKKVSSLVVSVAILLSLVSFHPALAADLPLVMTFWNEQEWGVLQYTNLERMKKGMKPFSTTEKLQKATRLRATELIKLYAHTRPNGTGCYTALEECGVPGYYGAENIAAGHLTSSAVTDGWMNSPGHRANILTSGFIHMGTGYAAGGSYKHNWVQMFTWGCSITGISMARTTNDLIFGKGTAIEDMGLVVVLNCSNGKSYMPLIAPMCSGYKANTVGKQTISVTYGSYKTSATVEIKATNVTPSYNISFKKGSGNGSFKTLKQKKNSTVTITDSHIAAFSRKGYVFAHFLGSDGVKYKKGNKITVKSNLTLTAKYSKISAPANAVTSLKLTSPAAKQLKVTYKAVSGATGYRIQCSTSKSFTKDTTKTVNTTKLTYTLKSLTAKQTYYVRVTAYKTDSTNAKLYSKKTATKSLKTR